MASLSQPPDTFTFVGVTTGQSAATWLFPLWARELELHDVRLVGCDLPIHAEATRYREVVQRIKNGEHERGALVTTHKIDLYESCRDLFDEVDAYAELCGEASCISKRGTTLRARATDPIAVRASLAEFVPRGHWGATGGDVFCLGAGGSAIAITLHLMTQKHRADRPRRIIVVNRSQERLDAMRAIHNKLNSDTQVDYIQSTDPSQNDELMSRLRPASLVINATGMGKDTPGSPLTAAARFPERGLAWELNYRGELPFLLQARRQEAERRLTIRDGWRYFLHGWTVIIEEVFDVQIGLERFNRLAAIATNGALV